MENQRHFIFGLIGLSVLIGAFFIQKMQHTKDLNEKNQELAKAHEALAEKNEALTLAKKKLEKTNGRLEDV